MMEELLIRLTELYESFLAFSKGNPVIAGIVGLWGLTVLTFFIRTVPSRIYQSIKRQATTTLVLNSHDNIYYEFLSWVSENNMHSFVRNLNFNNSARWGGGVPMISIGYGTTIFSFSKHLFFLTRSKVEAAQTSESKEVITLTLVGRDRDVFMELFNLIRKKADADKDRLQVFKWSMRNSRWELLCKQFERRLNTVIIEKNTKRELLKFIEDFNNKKDWYRENGIPYKAGIMLEGPPGTGKTSLIKALCCYLKKPLYLIDLSYSSDASLQEALSSAPEGALIAIEDIDTTNLGSRGGEVLQTEANPASSVVETTECSGMVGGDGAPAAEISLLPSRLSLGGVLNALDGAASAEDRLLIATSNCVKRLDPALLREGRFDLKLRIGYLTNETFQEYLTRFYPDYEGFDKWTIKENIAPCKVQKLIFENMEDPEVVLQQVCDYKDDIAVQQVGGLL